MSCGLAAASHVTRDVETLTEDEIGELLRAADEHPSLLRQWEADNAVTLASEAAAHTERMAVLRQTLAKQAALLKHFTAAANLIAAERQEERTAAMPLCSQTFQTLITAFEEKAPTGTLEKLLKTIPSKPKLSLPTGPSWCPIGVDSEADSRINPLQLAIIFNRADVLALYFSHINEMDATVIERIFDRLVETAVLQSGHDCLLFLLQQSISSRTPSIAATIAQHDATSALEISRAFVTSTPSTTALHAAASRGHNRSVEYLLKLGAPLSPVNSLKETLLHLAILGGHSECVRMLVEAGGITIDAAESLPCSRVLRDAISNGNDQLLGHYIAGLSGKYE